MQVRFMGEHVTAPEEVQTVAEPKTRRGPGSKAGPKPKKKNTPKKADEDSRAGNRRVYTDTYKSQRIIKDFVASHLMLAFFIKEKNVHEPTIPYCA